MKDYVRSEVFVGEGVHCAGLLEDRGVELLVIKVEIQSGSSHTNRISTIENTVERRSDELSFVIRCAINLL
jgi:hypothetical protein